MAPIGAINCYMEKYFKILPNSTFLLISIEYNLKRYIILIFDTSST